MRNELSLIHGFNGDYAINRNGEVYSRKRGDEWRKLKPYLLAGYYAVGLTSGTRRTITHIHRLLAITYLPNPENKPCVNHIDGDRLNNDLNNLEWATYQENSVHAFQTGLATNQADNHYLSKLSSDDVKDIRNSFGKVSTMMLSQKYDVHICTIQRIKAGKTWKSIG